MATRRLTFLASACGLALLATAPALAATAAPAAKRVETSISPVRIVTYNAEYGRSPERVVSDMKKLKRAGADVFGLQEMGSPNRRIAVMEQFVNCDTCEFDAFMPNTREQNAVPILWDSSKLHLVRTGTLKASASTYVGKSGAGPSTLKSKYVNWVLLRHRISGQKMYVLNSHAVPSVQGAGGGRNNHHPARLKLYRQHMNGLQDLIAGFETTGYAVFSTGDFNVNYRRDSIVRDSIFPYVKMAQVGVYASYKFLGMPEEGTHKSGKTGNSVRLIDYVFSLRHDAVSARGQKILSGFTSDHRPLLVRYRLTYTK